MLEQLGRYEEAIQVLLEGIQLVTLWEEKYSVNTERFATKIGDDLCELENFEAAVGFYEHARRANRGWKDFPNEGTISIYSALIIIYREIGQAKACLQLIDEIVPVVKQLRGADDPFLEELEFVRNEQAQSLA